MILGAGRRSVGGPARRGVAPKHPSWYANLLANQTEVTVQDGPEPFFVTVREVDGDDRAEWWARAGLTATVSRGRPPLPPHP